MDKVPTSRSSTPVRDTYQTPWYAISTMFFFYPKMIYALIAFVLISLLGIIGILLQWHGTIVNYSDIVNFLALGIYGGIYYIFYHEKQEIIPDVDQIRQRDIPKLKKLDKREKIVTYSFLVISISAWLVGFISAM